MKKLDAEKERDRLAWKRKEKEKAKKKAKHLMEKVKRLMDEADEEVGDGKKD